MGAPISPKVFAEDSAVTPFGTSTPGEAQRTPHAVSACCSLTVESPGGISDHTVTPSATSVTTAPSPIVGDRLQAWRRCCGYRTSPTRARRSFNRCHTAGRTFRTRLLIHVPPRQCAVNPLGVLCSAHGEAASPRRGLQSTANDVRWHTARRSWCTGRAQSAPPRTVQLERPGRLRPANAPLWETSRRRRRRLVWQSRRPSASPLQLCVRP